jgi:toxin CcdB
MHQFDVYANPSKITNKTYPYILDIQSDTISAIATRIVVPLARKSDFENTQFTRLTPSVIYKGEELLLLVPQLASIPAKTLTNPLGSLSHFRDSIVAALDFAITGI